MVQVKFCSVSVVYGTDGHLMIVGMARLEEINLEKGLFRFQDFEHMNQREPVQFHVNQDQVTGYTMGKSLHYFKVQDRLLIEPSHSYPG